MADLKITKEETVIEPVVAFRERNPSNWAISLLDDGDIEATCSGDYFKGTIEDFNVRLRD